MNNRTDTHVHIFRRDSTFAADRRYAPDYDALPQVLLGHMRAAGIGRAVLVQPSFLGTDNSFILETIAAAPETFSGIAVVDLQTSRKQMTRLRQSGIVGVRLNCIGKPLPDLAGAGRGLVTHLADLGMVLQIQAEAGQWQGLAAFLANPPLPVVIDHFGRTERHHQGGGLESLLRAAARSERVWFKFSAPYRMPPGAAAACGADILKVAGPDRILWGSDWPHTQHEGRQTYGETLGWLSDWLPVTAGRENVLCRNPARLFNWV